jgi:hypothetical protein
MACFSGLVNGIVDLAYVQQSVVESGQDHYQRLNLCGDESRSETLVYR